jgi:hypothetical protein
MQKEICKNIIKLQRSLFILLILSISSLTFAKDASNFRNMRYCELVVAKGMSAAVYTTAKLNNCPQNLWDRINIKKIKKQTGSNFIYLNGPRYFVIDGVTNTSLINDDIKSFGGIQMREAGIVKLTLKDLVRGFVPYKRHHVARKSTWIYKSGRPIFELISPSKQVYVMQSYSDEVIKQSEPSLAKLGAKLKLPKGWSFKTGILKKDTNLVTINNQAIVIQDNLKNTYQLATRDFLR